MPNEIERITLDKGNLDLKYPHDQSDRLQSKIVFQPIEIEGTEFKFQKAGSGGTGSGIDQRFNGTISGSRLTSMKLNKLNEKTELYLPLAFQVNDAMDYGSAELGLAGGAAYGAIGQGASLGQGVLKGIQEMGDSLLDLFNVVAGSGSLSAIAAARASSVPGVPSVARDIVGLLGRVVINPNVRTTFRGVQIRNFMFQFDFHPRSAEESVIVKRIIKRFRINAYPEETPGVGSIPVGYNYPNIYLIRLLSGKNGIFKNVGTPIKLSYLRNIEASYNRQPGEGLFTDGSPTHIALTLQFTEYKALSRQDIEKEDDDDRYFTYEGLTLPTGIL